MITMDGRAVGTVPETVPAAEAILDVLRLNGIDTIFSSPGSEWPAIWDALARPPREGERALRYLNTRHESLTVAAAAGYHKAPASYRPSSCTAPSGRSRAAWRSRWPTASKRRWSSSRATA